MRILFTAAVAACLSAVASPALAGDPIWGYECVTYPCYPTDYLVEDVRDEVTVDVNGPVVCVTDPCEQPPLLTVCVARLDTCQDVYVW